MRLYLRISSLLFGICMLCSSLTSAQDQQVLVEHYSIEDDLSQTAINTVMQDSRGFLWIGTQDGLNKFDGYNFTIFRNQPLDTNSLSNNYIHSICEDRNGDLWIGTNYGLNKYDYDEGKFIHFIADPTAENALKEDEVYYVYEGSEGYIWIKTLSFLSRYNPNTGRFRHYEHYNDVFNFVSELPTFSILEDEKGILWVGTKDGLHFFDRELEIFKRYVHNPSDPTSISSNRIKYIYEDSKKRLWIGTEDGLNLYNRENETFQRFYNNPANPNSLSHNIVNILFEDHNGDLWIGTNDGLNRMIAPGRFEVIKSYVMDNQSILVTTVSSIIEDNSNILWVGTLQGLIKVVRNSRKFSLYSKRKDNSALFTNNYIYSIYRLRKEVMWVGTWGAGLHIYNRRTNQIEVYNTQNSTLGNDYVHVIYPAENGEVWLGTQSGIYITDPGEIDFRSFKQDHILNMFRNNRIFAIDERKEGDYWIGTRYGLHHIVGDSLESFFHDPRDSTSLSSNLVYDLLIDEDSSLWVATDNGLNHYQPKSNSFKWYRRTSLACPDCISTNDVLCLYDDTLNNYLWVGTMSGLNRLDRETGKFKIYTESDGLANNFIYAIQQDNEGDIWLSSNRGITKMDIEKEEFSNFGLSDGLQNYEYNLGASFKADDGEMFFGGISGLNAFYPDSISQKQIVPPIAITSLELITNKERKNIRVLGNDIVEIPYQNTLVTIGFSALDYVHPEKNKYAYKIEGVEEEWIDLGYRRYATFSNLAPGEYNFRVIGSNADNTWNEEGTSLTIIVPRPFWKTQMAYLFYIITGALLIYWFFQYRTKSLRKSNQELKEKELIAKQVARQKEELTIKNKNITDSIIYAKRIQEALMPSMPRFKRILPQSFVLYKPKDIVSGDFYWVNTKGDKTFVAVVDCTGHGVPGAFMSIIGFELLRNITDDQGIEDANQILIEMNKGVATTFGMADSKVQLKDGMDLALIVFDKKEKTLQFSGAFRPLYYVRDNKIEEIKGERFSVGMMNEEDINNMKTTLIKLQPNDIFYLFTDGYADQFGGPEEKKYKYRRFRHLLLTIHKLEMEQQKEYLDRSIEDWKGELEQVDDILIVGFRPLLA